MSDTIVDQTGSSETSLDASEDEQATDTVNVRSVNTVCFRNNLYGHHRFPLVLKA